MVTKHLPHFQSPFCNCVHNCTSEEVHTAQNTSSFLPGIQICLLIVVFILPAVLGMTTTCMIQGLVSSGVTLVKPNEVDEPSQECVEC